MKQIPNIFDVCSAPADTFRTRPDLPLTSKKSVWRRDLWCCQFCGVQSFENQETIGIGGAPRDLSKVHTACLFCWQCFDFDGLSDRHSGLLIYLPEMDQGTLNRALLQTYCIRLGEGPFSDSAKRVLDAVGERAAHVRKLIDGQEFFQLALQQRRHLLSKWKEEDSELARGLRIMCRDRWMVRDGELKFNQFPQFMTYWRSAGSGFDTIEIIRGDQSAFMGLMNLLLPTELLRLEQAEDAGEKTVMTHAELGAKLLRDAAVFFRTVGERNPALARQMNENASVFEQVARLVAEDPFAGFPGQDNELTRSFLGAKLLVDAANFFSSVGFQNPPLQKQMEENSSVFEQVARFLKVDPTGVIKTEVIRLN